jgi:hypothetical protein
VIFTGLFVSVGLADQGNPKELDLTGGRNLVLKQNEPKAICIEIKIANPSAPALPQREGGANAEVHILVDKDVDGNLENYKVGELVLKWDGKPVKCSPTGCAVDQPISPPGIHKLTISSPDKEIKIWRFLVNWGWEYSNIAQVKEVPCASER